MPSTKRKASEDASTTSSKVVRTAAATDRVVSSTTLHPPPPPNTNRKAPTCIPQSRTDPSMKLPPAARRQLVGKTASGTAILSGGVYMPPLIEQSNHSYQSYISRLSSITPTTNAIDEVINEVNHLLQAASEAQALGRLRNSYSSLLLAHQRLVGLGRRVDRSYCEAEVDEPESSASKGEISNLSFSSVQTPKQPPIFMAPLVSQPPLPPNLTQSNYTDVAYVEYLAKSGMELHHKRTGRGMQHEAAIERAAHSAKAKKVDDAEINKAAAKGVFALQGKDGEEGEPDTPSKRKGGRGKKPPTLVMHTMAGRNLDVRELMLGKI